MVEITPCTCGSDAVTPVFVNQLGKGGLKGWTIRCTACNRSTAVCASKLMAWGEWDELMDTMILWKKRLEAAPENNDETEEGDRVDEHCQDCYI